MASEKVVHLTDDSFDEQTGSGYVMIDFWAEWCGPCKAIGPALEEIADSHAGQITIAKLNIDENPETPQAYNVRGIPTLLIFKSGEMVAEKIGAMPKSALEQWVADNL